MHKFDKVQIQSRNPVHIFFFAAKRPLPAFLLSVAIIIAGVPASPALSAEPVARAKDFIDFIGVNVHAMYTDGGYANLDRIIASLNYLGITNLRDFALDDGILAARRYGRLAAEGYHFDFFVKDDLSTSIARLGKFQAQHPGSVAAVEGPNEVNNWPITFNGMHGHDGAVAFQSALFSAVRADPTMSRIPVYNFTDYPQPAGQADYLNVHPYPKGGVQPFNLLKDILPSHIASISGKVSVVTEAGYNAMLDPSLWMGSAEWAPVNEDIQAILISNLLLDSFALGAPRVYLYQLLDAYADPQNKEADKHLGLFDLQYAPKPAATAIHNLTTLLADSESTSHSFSVRPVAYSLTGLPNTAHAMMLEKADGTEIVVIWNEPVIWDSLRKAPVAVPETTITLNLGAGRRELTVYDPVLSPAVAENLGRVDHAEIQLAERPLLVFLAPDGRPR